MMPPREPKWRRYVAFLRPSVDRDVEAEFRFHFEERVADLIARGRTEAEARAEAEGEFGDMNLYRDRVREIDHRVQARRNRAEWLEVLGTDIRLSLRGMARSPALSIMVVVTLALGIGANGAIFSMLDRLFLRPPPGVANPSEIRRLMGDYKAPPPSPGFKRQVFRLDEFTNIRAALGDQVPVAGYRTELVRLGTENESPMAEVADVLGDYFSSLGVRPWRGRFFLPEELNAPGMQNLVVVSHRFWKRHFNSDEQIIGREVPLSRTKFIVIGIAPPEFDGLDLDAVDMWRPANTSAPYYGKGSASVRMIVRVPPMSSELALLHTANNGLHVPDDRLARQTILFFRSLEVGGQSSSGESQEADIAKRLGGVTLIVLLIAVANVANILLTRAIERRREISIRVALGISRARLAGLLVTESAVLAAIAGAAALIVATWGALLIRRLLLPDVRWASGPFDLRLAGYTFAVALFAGLFAGLLPFARTRRFDLANSMRGGARDGAGTHSRTRAALIVTQAALSVVLLVGATLFVRSLQAVRALDIGYEVEGLIMATANSGQRVIPAAEFSQGITAARDRIAALPGVRSAAVASLTPMEGLNFTELHFPGRDSLPQAAGGSPTFTSVSPEFFKTMGISIIAGRDFRPSDSDGAPRVTVVTRTMARVAWGVQNPIGQCIIVGKKTDPCTTVIGVSEDVRRRNVVEDEHLMFFLPLAQSPGFSRGANSLLVRADPEAVPAVSRQLNATILSVLTGSRPSIATFAEKLDPQYRPWRIGATLFAAFGILALIVAAIGIYSAISYAVTQRSHEIGVRLALGAQASQIGRIVIGTGLRLVGAGVILGVVASLALSRLIDALLYGTNSRDPVVLAEVAAVLLIVATLAAALPAWRATRLDPVNALRVE